MSAMRYMNSEALRDALIRRLHRHSIYMGIFVVGELRTPLPLFSLYRRDLRRWRRALRQGRWLPSGELLEVTP